MSNDYMKSGAILFHETQDGHDVLIRYPVIEDARGMMEYINALSQERTYILAQGKEFTFEEEKEYVRDKIKEIEKGLCVKGLLFVDGVLAGISEVDAHTTEYADAPQGGFGISIAQPFRGNGYGKLLMRTVLDEARRVLPIRMIVLKHFGNNSVARKMYESFGFVEVGRIPGGSLHRGEYVDDVTMMLSLV